MAGEKHLYLVARGDYNSAGLASEEWQVGIRLALVFGAVDPIGTLPSNWNPTASTIARTESDWRIDGNWSVDGPVLATFSPDDYLNDQAAPAFSDWVSQGGINTLTRLNSLSIYPIDSSGDAVPAPPYAVGSPVVLTWTSSNPHGGGGGTGLLPLQVSVVASHRTGQLGRKGRGRMFIPGIASGNIVNGLIANSGVSDFVDVQVALLEALKVDTLAFGVRAIVTGKPFVPYAVITSVDCGNVADTQRRRRAQLIEARTSGSVDIS